MILEDKAALIVDSRYTLQAKAQTDAALYSVELTPKMKVGSWLAANGPKAPSSAMTRRCIRWRVQGA